MSAEILLPKIYKARGEAVMLDSELSLHYGVETGQFNRAMKRNAARFPADFTFRLTQEEWEALRCQIGTLKTASRGQHRKYLPQVFTEHGGIMAATVLNSARAVAMSVYVVRAFVKIRRELQAWLWNRLHISHSALCTPHSTWPRRLVYCLPMRTLLEQTRDHAAGWLKKLADAHASDTVEEIRRVKQPGDDRDRP